MAVVRALNWLGRQGTRAVATSLIAGLALPHLAVLARPFLPLAVFALLTMAFARIGSDDLRRLAGARRQVFIAAIWTMVAIPLLIGAGLYILSILIPLPGGFVGTLATPGLAVGIILMVSAPPVVSSPAFAALLGLDAAYSLAMLVACMALTPFVAPLIVALWAGNAVSIDPVQLGIRLGALMGLAACAAMIVRRFAGATRLGDNKDMLDGINVVLLFVFIVALMGDATLQFINDPARVITIVALTFLTAGAIMAMTMLRLRNFGPVRAITAAFAASNRNMGLMPAAVGASLPPDTWLWFALAQFPIYLLPLIAAPLATRALRGEERRARP
ncbi:MAG: Na+-dependent transporter [Alphaproteobacteria bacterium]